MSFTAENRLIFADTFLIDTKVMKKILDKRHNIRKNAAHKTVSGIFHCLVWHNLLSIETELMKPPPVSSVY